MALHRHSDCGVGADDCSLLAGAEGWRHLGTGGGDADGGSRQTAEASVVVAPALQVTAVERHYGLETTLGDLLRARQCAHCRHDSAADLLLLSGVETSQGQ